MEVTKDGRIILWGISSYIIWIIFYLLLDSEEFIKLLFLLDIEADLGQYDYKF